MREVIAAGNADLAQAGSAARLDAEQVVAWMFAQTDSMGDYRTSMAIDYVHGRPLEVEAILGEPLRRGDGGGRRNADGGDAVCAGAGSGPA